MFAAARSAAVKYTLKNKQYTAADAIFASVVNFDFPEEPMTYKFDDIAVPVLDSAVARYEPAQVRGFLDPRTGEVLTGDVRLGFSTAVESKREGSGVRLDLDPTARENLLSDCDRYRPVNACGATPIRNISTSMRVI